MNCCSTSYVPSEEHDQFYKMVVQVTCLKGETSTETLIFT